MKILNFGNNLRRLREEHGLSMDLFCTYFNERYDAKLNKSTISRYEKELQEPAMSTAIKIAEFFSVEIDDLLYDSESIKGVKIPVLGSVPAGIPIEAIEDIVDYEEIPESMARNGEYFGLRVNGESMVPIFNNGDTVIIQKQDSADTGDYVVAMINGGEATLKRLKRFDDGIILIPNNPEFFPVTYTNEQIESLPVRILGKVVELRRKF